MTSSTDLLKGLGSLAKPTLTQDIFSGLGSTGQFLGGAGSLYSGVQGTNIMKDQQNLSEDAYYNQKKRQDEEDQYLSGLSF